METPVIERQVAFRSWELGFRTERARAFLDITDQVAERVAASGITNGIAVIASQHTTASIAVNEHEPELLKDLDAFLSGLAAEQRDYAHNLVPCDYGEQPNGHAHCQALLLNASASIPIVGSSLVLGRYQRIFLVELDCARPRQVTVTALGA